MKISTVLKVILIFFILIVFNTGCDTSFMEMKKNKEDNTILVTEENSNKIIETTEKISEENFYETTLTEKEVLQTEEDVLQAEEILQSEMYEYLDNLTIEEKVAQLFVILPESLIGIDCVTAAGKTTEEKINEIPVGGLIYMSPNIQSKEQTTEMLANVQRYSLNRIGLPAFICIDEEGGSVTRIGNNKNFNVPIIDNMSVIGRTKDTNKAYEAGIKIGSYLSELGFNVDFAPVADVLSNTENIVVKERSFGSNPELTADMAIAVYNGLNENGIIGTFKHFPGHGATSGDTHEGYAYTSKTLDELFSCELIPFQKCIDAGADFIMVGHISLPNIIGDNTPASLSEVAVNQILRKQMGYNGIVITDALNMGAIAQNYSSSEAAVKALQAGADIILMPSDFKSAYYGVLEAVKNGNLSVERIDESVERILNVKLSLKKQHT